MNEQSTREDRTINNLMGYAIAPLGEEKTALMESIQDAGLVLLDLISKTGESRELSLAKTKTEEAVMWAVKHITA